MATCTPAHFPKKKGTSSTGCVRISTGAPVRHRNHRSGTAAISLSWRHCPARSARRTPYCADIHLTDDGSFTFPSSAYPELAGNAPFKYTLAELTELQAYAVARGVTIIGEMDVPGHSSGLTRALPNIFGFPSDPTVDVCDFTNVSPALLRTAASPPCDASTTTTTVDPPSILWRPLAHRYSC